jgi:hypothetical protein
MAPAAEDGVPAGPYVAGMNRKLVWLAPMVAAAGSVPALAASHPARPPRVLTLTAVIDAASVHTTDVGRKGPSAGDLTVYSATLRRGSHTVGRLEGYTVAADPRYQGDVRTAYLVLRDGTVAVVGGGQSGAPGVGRPDSRVYDAIVGGTGRYTGAGGWVGARDLNDTTQRMTLHFTR